MNDREPPTYDQVLTMLHRRSTTQLTGLNYSKAVLSANLINVTHSAPIKKQIAASNSLTYEELMTGFQWSDPEMRDITAESDFDSILSRSVKVANNHDAHKTALIISLSFLGSFFFLFLIFILYRRWNARKKKEVFRPGNLIYCPVIEPVFDKKKDNSVGIEMGDLPQVDILSTNSNDIYFKRHSSVQSINEIEDR
jgi:hypothetical protein